MSGGQPFASSPGLSVGIEEELILVGAETLALRHDSERVLAAMDAAAGAAGAEVL